MIKMKNGYTLIELMVTIFILGFILTPILVTPWTSRSLDWIASTFKHQAVHISYWLAFGLTILLNWLSLFFNLLIEIIRSIVG